MKIVEGSALTNIPTQVPAPSSFPNLLESTNSQSDFNENSKYYDV